VFELQERRVAAFDHLKVRCRWQPSAAARGLQEPGASVAQTAERVGDDSEAAFSRAFQRHMRVAPAIPSADCARYPREVMPAQRVNRSRPIREGT